MARNFQEEALQYIMHPSTASLPFLAYLNVDLADQIQELYSALRTGRTKALLAQLPRLELNAHFVIIRQCDVDNRIKALQDVLAEGIGFIDTAVVSVHAHKTVQRDLGTPFVDVILKITQEEFPVGFLLENTPCLPTRALRLIR